MAPAASDPFRTKPRGYARLREFRCSSLESISTPGCLIQPHRAVGNSRIVPERRASLTLFGLGKVCQPSGSDHRTERTRCGKAISTFGGSQFSTRLDLSIPCRLRDRRHRQNQDYDPNRQSGEVEYIHLSLSPSLIQEDDTDDGPWRSAR
jgi:hypothetical protein